MLASFLHPLKALSPNARRVADGLHTISHHDTLQISIAREGVSANGSDGSRYVDASHRISIGARDGLHALGKSYLFEIAARSKGCALCL